jgi:ubiquinol-cytochrome c reductase cytochrome c subunit
MRVAAAAVCTLVLAGSAAAAGDPQHGKQLFQTGCASCHGLDARGIRGRGPDLHGAGAAAADFYLRTGRMPLDSPRSEPQRSEPAYPSDQIDHLVAYIGSLGGPAVPTVDPAQGSVSDGQRLFAANCAQCHQIVGRGGAMPGASIPTLLHATPTQIAEAVRIGPYVMPRFGPDQISDGDLASIARYVQYAKHPRDEGGWGMFDIGPVPEGMATWFVGALALVLLIRVLGKRAGE